MSIVAGLRTSARLSPDKKAIICEEKTWTFAEFDRLTDNVASQLLTGGIRPGERISVHMLNCAEAALSYIGCLKAGAIVVPINPRLKGREIAYILRHSEAVCYIGQADLYSEVSPLRKELADLRLCFLSGDGSREQGVRKFEEVLQPVSTPISLPEITADHTAVIIYTSGTTAQPKGVTHPHKTFTHIAETMLQLNLDEHQVTIATSSMAHILSFSMIFAAGLLNRATVVLIPQIDCQSVLRAFERHRCTVMAGLPTFFQAIARAQTATPYNVSSGKHFFCGGDSVSPALQEEFQRAMGQTVFEGYGSTEVVPLTFNRQGAARVGSIGRAVEGVQIRLLDRKGAEVPPGEIGEICIQSPWLMTGYWKDPEATAETIRDGWFHTGDLARCDADGFYWFTGRAKQIIIRGGSNISPQEVESVLGEHPAVREVAVIGRPDSTWGEIVVAYVVLKNEQKLSAEELVQFARERMATYKSPEHIIFRDALPKNATGKMDRRALSEAERRQPTS